MEPYYPCNWVGFINRKNKKDNKLKFVNNNYIYWYRYYFSKQLICILYTYSLNMQTTKTSSSRIRSETFILLEIILNVFNVWQYHFRIKILILAIVTLLFISVCILCEFAILLDVYILLSLRKKRCTILLYEQMYIAGSTFIKKRLNPLSVIILVCLGNT